MTTPVHSVLNGLPGVTGQGSSATTATNTATGDPQALGQDDFLRLMTAQLEAQDPFKPLDSGQFLSQFAAFGTVSGIEALKGSFDGLSSSLKSLQALQASSLVGRDVLVAADTATLASGGQLRGVVDAQGATQVTLSYHDAGGALVHRVTVPTAADGRAEFTWDGRDGAGVQLPAGRYHIAAEGEVDGEARAFATHIETTVDSVTLGQGGLGLTLNLAGLGAVDAANIVEIK